jgi:chaperonin cofactor prefoldin
VITFQGALEPKKQPKSELEAEVRKLNKQSKLYQSEIKSLQMKIEDMSNSHALEIEQVWLC